MVWVGARMTLGKFLMGYQPNVEPSVAFWSRDDLWPDDSPDHIFAARAVRTFAKSRFGGGWLDDIPASPKIFELPTDYSIYTPIEEIRRATAILGSISSSYNKGPREGAATLLTAGNTFPTTDEWAQAVAEAKVRSDRFWTRYILFYRTVLELAQACKAGTIKSATRPHSGGEPITRLWHFWNLERGEIRFDTCRVDPKDDFAPTPFAEPGHWLFFEKKSFESYMAGQQESAPKEQLILADIAAAKRSRPRGRPRGSQIDLLAGRFAHMVWKGEITAESKIRDIARRLADLADAEFEAPLDEGYIRERATIWHNESFPDGND